MALLKARCSNLLKKVAHKSGSLTIFFTYGDVVECDSHPTDGVYPDDSVHRNKYNGLIASVDLLVAITTVALAISLTPYLAEDFLPSSKRIPELTLIVFMIMGLTTLFLFAHREDAFAERSRLETRRRICNGSDQILLVAGLVLFYTLSFVLDMFNCLAQMQCGGEWMAYGTNSLKIDYVVDVLFHIIRTIYLGCSTLFVVIYGHVVLADKCWIRYGLAILYGCNLAIWFDVLLHESSHTDETHSYVIPSPLPFLNCSLVNNWTDIIPRNLTVECICQQTDIFKLLNGTISQVCYPFMYECTVVLGERFVHWLHSCSPVAKKEKYLNRNASSIRRKVYSIQNRRLPDQLVTDEYQDSDIPSEYETRLVQYASNYPEVEDTNCAESDEGMDDSDDEGVCDSEESADFYDPHYCDDSLLVAEDDQHAAPDNIRRNGVSYNPGASEIPAPDNFAGNPRNSNECRLCQNANECNCRVDSCMRGVHDAVGDSQVSLIAGAAPEDAPSSLMMSTLFFLTTVSTNIIFFVLSLLPLALKGKTAPSEFATISRIFLWYSTIYYIIVFIVVVVGFVVARDFPLRRSRSSFQGLDYLLLVTASGPFAYNIISIIAIAFDPSVLTRRGLGLCFSLVLQFANLFEVFVQIPFCFFSGKVIAMNFNGTRRPRAKYFQAVLIYLSVSNATLWLINSFATTFNGANVYYAKDIFKDIWTTINNFLLPLTLFFRFNSSLLLLKALRVAFKKPRPPTRMASARFN